MLVQYLKDPMGWLTLTNDNKLIMFFFSAMIHNSEIENVSFQLMIKLTCNDAITNK